MSEPNPLVAKAPTDGDGPGPLTAGNSEYGYAAGIGVAESAMDAFNGIKDGNWVAGGLGVLSLAGEMASAAIDPFGYLMSSVASFLMEHMQPLKDMLDSVAGDPPVIQSYSETWGNIAKSLEETKVNYENNVKNGTAGWTGDAADAYRKEAAEQAEAIAAAATVAGTVGTVVMIFGEVVAFVREFIRELIAEAVGKLISWVMETVFSLGFGTPVVVAQAVTAIAEWAAKIAKKLDDLCDTIRRVSPLLGKLADVFVKIIKIFGKITGKLTGLDALSPKRIQGDRFLTRGRGGDGPDGGGATPGSGRGDGPDGSNGSDGPDGSGPSTRDGSSPDGSSSDPGDGPSNVRSDGDTPSTRSDTGGPSPHSRTDSPAPGNTRPDGESPSPGSRPDSNSPSPGSRPDSDTPSPSSRPDSSSPSPSSRPDSDTPSPGSRPDSSPSPSARPDGDTPNSRPDSPSPSSSRPDSDTPSPSSRPDSSPSPSARPDSDSPSPSSSRPDSDTPSPGSRPDSPSPRSDGGDAPSTRSDTGGPSGDGPRSDTPPSRTPDSSTTSSGTAPTAPPPSRVGDAGPGGVPPQRGGPDGSPQQSGPVGGGMAPGAHPGGAGSPGGVGGRPGSSGPAGWTGTPGTRTPDAPTPRTPDAPAPRTPEPGRPHSPAQPHQAARGEFGPGTGGHPDGPHGDGPDLTPERPLTPDEVNQRHSESTPSGSSYHRGDPDMGDLPQRVRPDPDGRYTVDVHVTPDGHARIGNRLYTPEQFADILRRNGDYDGRPIRLIGCDAGSNDFAKRLSRELDTEVMAPSKPAWTDSSGRVFSSDYEIGPDGKVRPKIPPNGEWDIHSPDGTSRRVGDDGFTPDTSHADKQDVDGDDAVARGKRYIDDEPVAIERRDPPASMQEKINDKAYRDKYYDGPHKDGSYTRKNADQTDYNDEPVKKIRENTDKPENSPERFEQKSDDYEEARYHKDREVEHPATTKQKEDAQDLIDRRAEANQRAREAESTYQDAKEKGTLTNEIEVERSTAHRDRTNAGEDLGEHAARDAVADKYPAKDYEVTELPDPARHGDNTRVGEKPGSGRFDQIYEVTDRNTGQKHIVVVEAKGPNAGLGVRSGATDSLKYEQGHPEYVKSIIENMRLNGTEAEKNLAEDLDRAMRRNTLEYSVAKARVREEDLLDSDGNKIPDPDNPGKYKQRQVYGGYNLKEFDLSPRPPRNNRE
ncbi:hypothetical protein [Amycolatopsis suaedae]|uniref:hypothetical protein n=1 Tax=Amycolatopsis suaedae TaxID=2510978 RepID=UPI001F0F14EE|nr:hypothetical protein [Amycolatopsis suaedae]